MLKLDKINKSFFIRKGKSQVVLNDLNVTFPNKGFISILGNSGNGKTTLLNIIGGLEYPDSGDVIFNDEKVKDFDKFRRENLGYVFQDSTLINHLNAVDNVITSMSGKNKKERATNILQDLGLGNDCHKTPKELSGGERQRVAIARMIAKDVDVIICDEPTGDLDETTGVKIVELIKKLSIDRLVIFVTHNKKLANQYSDQVLNVKNGKIVQEVVVSGEIPMATKKNFNNIVWLAFKNFFGRLKYTIKYVSLIALIFLIASMTIILRGDFFNRYLHEEFIDEGIKYLVIDTEDDYLLESLEELDNVQHISYYYGVDMSWRNYSFYLYQTISVGPQDLEGNRVTTEFGFENITNNQYVMDIISEGRYPEVPGEIMMTAEGAISLLRDLNKNDGGERLFDQFMTGEMSSEYVFSLVKNKYFHIVEYGQPLVQISGLIDDERFHEEAYDIYDEKIYNIYFVDGFFDLFTYPNGPIQDQIKLYKSDLYKPINDQLVSEINALESLTVNEEHLEIINDIYSRIDSFLALSSISLMVILVITVISFVSLLFTSLFERSYEVGIYRAIGYKNRAIMKIFAIETFLIGISSLIIVIMSLVAFTIYMYFNYDYLDDYMLMIENLNIKNIMLMLLVLVGLLVIVVVGSSKLILRKSVLENIRDN